MHCNHDEIEQPMTSFDDKVSDDEAFVRLFVAIEPRIFAYIRTLVPNRADADEVLQETVLVLWRKFSEFEPGSDFTRWAYRIASFQVKYYRQKQKRSSLLFSNQFVETIAQDGLAQADRLADLREPLARCLDKLGERDRDLLSRCYGGDDSAKQVAQQLGRPANTVYKALQRIRRSLYRCIQQSLAAEAQG